MALVNGGFLHYMDMKKFLKNFFFQNRLSDFEIISQENVPWVTPKNRWQNCDLSINMALVNFALYRHEEILKKSCSPKPLVRF